MISSEILVRVWRGSITESLHRGHIVVINHKGEIMNALGDPSFVTFARSTAKLLQVIPVIESGAADRFGFTGPELALMCASHNGEAEHVRTAQSILTKLGLSPEQLQCGVHEPFHQPTTLSMRANRENPTSLHNNCSGKHSGMLALAVHRQTPHDDYLSIGHPIQQTMLETVSQMCRIPQEQIHLGIDGCGVPVFGMSIDKLAAAYARLGHPEGLPDERIEACRRIIHAVCKHPNYLAGSDRFDTRLIEVTQGRIIGKMGAESIYAMTVPEAGLGIVIKIEDGNQRALYPAAAEVLYQLDLITSSELDALSAFHSPKIRNWQGTEVGQIRPDFRLAGI